MKSEIKKKILLSEADKQRVYVCDELVRCLSVKTELSKTKMSLVELGMGEFSTLRFLTFNKMIKHIIQNKFDVDWMVNDKEIITQTLHIYSNEIGVKNRRGKSNYILLNKKTAEKIGAFEMEIRHHIELCEAVPNGRILMMYLGDNVFDRCMHAIKKYGITRYDLIQDMASVNCKVMAVD